MAILFKDLDSQFLINKIVLREKDVKGNVVWCRDGADGIGFQSGNESRRKVLASNRSSDLRTDAIVQTPLDYLQTNIRDSLSEEEKHLRLSRDIAGARRTTGMYRRCSYSRMHSVCKNNQKHIPQVKEMIKKNIPPLVNPQQSYQYEGTSPCQQPQRLHEPYAASTQGPLSGPQRQ